VLVDHRVTPPGGHDPLQRHPLGRVVEAGLPGPVRPACQEIEGVHHRPEGGVVAAKRQRAEQPGQHPSVVVGVGGPQHGADLLLEHPLVRACLPHQVPQGLLATRHHRVQRGTHGLVGMVKGGLGEAEQDALLATHPVQLGEQLPLDAVLSAGVDLVINAISR
jgi:hypothetical protein